MDALLKNEVAEFQEASKGLDPLIEDQVGRETQHIQSVFELT